MTSYSIPNREGFKYTDTDLESYTFLRDQYFSDLKNDYVRDAYTSFHLILTNLRALYAAMQSFFLVSAEISELQSVCGFCCFQAIIVKLSVS